MTDTVSPKIDVTNPETAAWLKSKLFQADDGNDGLGDKNAALNNLRREISELRDALADAQRDNAFLLAQNNKFIERIEDLTQDNEILRGELASAREQLQAVAA